MFGKKTNDSTTARTISNSLNSIEKGTVIVGDIQSNGNFRVDGNVKGTVVSKSKLVVGPTGVIEGNIICKDAEIMGTVKGVIEASDTLTLTETANYNGDIKTGKLIVDAGAMFNGNCVTSGVKIKELNPANTNKQEAKKISA